MTEFEAALARAVRGIPRGMTASYAQVALAAGRPGAARAVVRGLYRVDGVPWWRVIKSDGTVAKEMEGKQVPKLRAEGVEVRGRKVAPAHRLAR